MPATDAAHLPANWQVRRVTQDTVLVPAPGKTGKAICLRSPFTAYESGVAFQELAVKKRGLNCYQLTASVRTKELEGRGAYLTAYGTKGDQTIGIQQSESLNGSNDWTELSLKLVIDERVDSIQIVCRAEGEGAAWFDDLKWEELGSNADPIGPEAVTYLDTFFQYVSTNALGRDTMDWKAMREQVDRICAGAETPADTHHALMYILGRINKHSFMIPPQTAQNWSTAAPGEDNNKPKDIPLTTGHRIDDEIAYLSMPSFGGGHPPTMQHFADTLQRLIAAMDSPETKGWVLDLRKNTGGNCWPMLAGIGPLLGEGICGYFTETNGDNAMAWIYKDGGSFQGEMERVALSGEPYELMHSSPRIAVLTGPKTTSSGEVMTIAFRGKANAKSFGRPTGGYSTTNTNFQLSDGAMVILTVSVYADRTMQIYGEEVVPDVMVEEGEEIDAALEVAIAWLRE